MFFKSNYNKMKTFRFICVALLFTQSLLTLFWSFQHYHCPLIPKLVNFALSLFLAKLMKVLYNFYNKPNYTC